MAAAILLPPFLPLATIQGSLLSIIISFEATTFTKPTGTPITPSGFTFPSLISSVILINAVGAFPMAK